MHFCSSTSCPPKCVTTWPECSKLTCQEVATPESVSEEKVTMDFKKNPFCKEPAVPKTEELGGR